MDYKELYTEALERAKVAHKDEDRHLKATLERIFPELQEDNDERIRKAIISCCLDHGGKYKYLGASVEEMCAWLEKQGNKEQTWKPNAAQLIVIKDLIEDKNTSNLNKAILRNMLTEFKQFTNTNKREIDDAYLQGICDAKQELEKQGEQKSTDKAVPKFKIGDWL